METVSPVEDGPDSGAPRGSVLILVPFRVGSETLTGNEVTARRWQRLIATIGYRVDIGIDGSEAIDSIDQRYDVILALHAVRSAIGIRRALSLNLKARIILALTGTDINAPDADDEWRHLSHQSIAFAHRLVLLNELASESLPQFILHRSNARVIPQSARPDPAVLEARASRTPDRPSKPFRIVQLAHLREVKKPFLLPEALTLIPEDTPVVATHAGAEIDEGYSERARAWQAREPRYRYLGARGHRDAVALFADADLAVLCSSSEGGPNVFAEALAHGVPVVTTPTAAARSLFGDEYPGLVPFDDPAALADKLRLLARNETAYDRLLTAAKARAELVAESQELRLLAELLNELRPESKKYDK